VEPPLAQSCIRAIRSAWKTITLGTGLETADDFYNALKQGGFTISEFANELLRSSVFKVATKETQIDLIVVSVAELGFANGGSRKDVYNRAHELGLGLCPAEVGPQLRLQYKDQPNNEWYRIAMDPIVASNGKLFVFSIGSLGGERPFSSAVVGSPEDSLNSLGRWVFVRTT